MTVFCCYDDGKLVDLLYGRWTKFGPALFPIHAVGEKIYVGNSRCRCLRTRSVPSFNTSQEFVIEPAILDGTHCAGPMVRL